MKLTKSQRLFVKVGELLAREKVERWLYKIDYKRGIFSRGYEKNAKAIAIVKRKRKKLIREAVLEAQAEFEEAYRNGWRDGFWDE